MRKHLHNGHIRTAAAAASVTISHDVLWLYFPPRTLIDVQNCNLLARGQPSWYWDVLKHVVKMTWKCCVRFPAIEIRSFVIRLIVEWVKLSSKYFVDTYQISVSIWKLNVKARCDLFLIICAWWHLNKFISVKSQYISLFVERLFRAGYNDLTINRSPQMVE